jgi:hypothetical protein
MKPIANQHTMSPLNPICKVSCEVDSEPSAKLTRRRQRIQREADKPQRPGGLDLNGRRVYMYVGNMAEVVWARGGDLGIGIQMGPR